jgi:hypothetical protein
LSQLVEEEVGLWTTDIGDEEIISSKVGSNSSPMISFLFQTMRETHRLVWTFVSCTFYLLSVVEFLRSCSV